MEKAGYHNITEADAGSIMVSRYGVDPERVWLDFFAAESIGNSLFIGNLLRQLGASSLLIVTEASHGLRLVEFARHLYPGLRADVFAVPCPPMLDLKRGCEDNSSGSVDFRTRFLKEVPRGDGDAALRWLEQHHWLHPYKDIRSLNEVNIPRLDQIGWIIGGAHPGFSDT
jgi:hypothetical protein